MNLWFSFFIYYYNLKAQLSTKQIYIICEFDKSNFILSLKQKIRVKFELINIDIH